MFFTDQLFKEIPNKFCASIIYHGYITSCVFDLLQCTEKISMGKMFGTYFHSLLIRSPCQYEIIAQSSVNTEKQERLCGEARTTASGTSNRTPENVIKSILLHYQSKLLLTQEASTNDSRVSKLAQSSLPYEGISIPKEFIDSRPTSWQAHLERIASFLENGPGYWWNEGDDSFKFLDGDHHSSHCPNGPNLLDFTSDHMLTDSADHSAGPSSSVVVTAEDLPTFNTVISESEGVNLSSLVATHPTAKDPTSETDDSSQESDGFIISIGCRP